jgi:hypothetical protein
VLQVSKSDEEYMRIDAQERRKCVHLRFPRSSRVPDGDGQIVEDWLYLATAADRARGWFEEVCRGSHANICY